MKSLREFLETNRRNAWINERGFELYVRVAHHMLGSVHAQTFDLANVNLVDERQRGSMRKRHAN